MNSKLQSALSDMQGQLFVMSASKGLNSESFIKVFMTSEIAADLDSEFSFMQWSGKEYIMERILDELKDKIEIGGEIYDKETLFWTGYVYRRWHFYTNESSAAIYKQAPAKTMRITYLPYHTMSEEMAINRLKESYKDKHKK